MQQQGDRHERQQLDEYRSRPRRGTHLSRMGRGTRAEGHRRCLEALRSGRRLESPLVRYLLGGAEGIVRGRDNLRNFVKLVFASAPSLRRRHRNGFFTDGKRLIWEYPREAPNGPKMDPVEGMDVAAGLIQRRAD